MTTKQKPYYLDKFSILKAAAAHDFTHLDKSALYMIFDQLCKIDRDFKRIGPSAKITKENIREEWKLIFEAESLGPAHPYFKNKDKKLDPETLILKKYRSKDIYHKLVVNNLSDVTNKFRKNTHPAAPTPTSRGEPEEDEGTELDEEESKTPEYVSPCKSAKKGQESTSFPRRNSVDEASITRVDAKNFFRDLKIDTNRKIEEQIDQLADKFCQQLEILEKDVAQNVAKCKKLQSATDQNKAKIDHHDTQLKEMSEKVQMFSAILNIQENTEGDKFLKPYTTQVNTGKDILTSSLKMAQSTCRRCLQTPRNKDLKQILTSRLLSTKQKWPRDNF